MTHASQPRKRRARRPMGPPRIRRTTITAAITATTVTATERSSLGPINIAAWGAGLFGAIVGLVIAACFVRRDRARR